MKSKAPCKTGTNLSQVDRVINYLAANPGVRTITPATAASRFGIVNIRSVMTKVRDRVANWESANWGVDSEVSPRGTRHYSLFRSAR